jgi:hypothetical protein
MVWDSKTGLRISSPLDSVQYAGPLNSVCWHPQQHVIAVCCYGGDYPVLMYSADRDPTKSSSGAGMVEEIGEEADKEEVVRSAEEEAERAAAIAEKRRLNRERFAQLKKEAMARRGGGDE